MACMTHICIKCEWFVMDNYTWRKCPECGGPIQSDFDEEEEHYPSDVEYADDKWE